MTLEDLTDEELEQIKASFEKLADKDLASSRKPAAEADEAS